MHSYNIKEKIIHLRYFGYFIFVFGIKNEVFRYIILTIKIIVNDFKIGNEIDWLNYFLNFYDIVRLVDQNVFKFHFYRKKAFDWKIIWLFFLIRTNLFVPLLTIVCLSMFLSSSRINLTLLEKNEFRKVLLIKKDTDNAICDPFSI